MKIKINPINLDTMLIETKKVFYDKLTFIYLEMPKFNKTVEVLENRFEKWLYVLRNLNKLDRIPDSLREDIFEKLFETAEIAKFTPEQVSSYEDSLKYYRDLKNSLDTAKQEGIEEGLEKGMKQGIEKGMKQGLEQGTKEVAKKLLAMNVSIAIIQESTGLTEEEIKALQ